MTPWLRPGSWLLILLIGSVVYSAATLMLLRRQQRQQVRTEQHQDQVLAEVHAVLVVWAETWPDPVVRQQLLAVLKRGTQGIR